MLKRKGAIVDRWMCSYPTPERDLSSAIEYAGIRDWPRGYVDTYEDLILCNGIKWHKDSRMNKALTALKILKNDGFKLEGTGVEPQNQLGEIIILDHFKRHRLTAPQWKKGLIWIASSFMLNEYNGDRIAIEKQFQVQNA